MKLTESTLKQIIREEILSIIKEQRTQKVTRLSNGSVRVERSYGGQTGVGVGATFGTASKLAEKDLYKKTQAAPAPSQAASAQSMPAWAQDMLDNIKDQINDKSPAVAQGLAQELFKQINKIKDPNVKKQTTANVQQSLVDLGYYRNAAAAPGAAKTPQAMAGKKASPFDRLRRVKGTPGAAAAKGSGQVAYNMQRLKSMFVDKGADLPGYSTATTLAASILQDAPENQKKAIASELSKMGFDVEELASIDSDQRIVPGSPVDKAKRAAASAKAEPKQQNQNKYMGMGTRTILKTLFPRLKIKDAFARLKKLKSTHPARIAYRDAYGKGNRS